MAKSRKQKIPGTRAVIYIRVSTQEQVRPGHFGVDAQLATCTAYAASKGYTIVAIEQDLGISGTKDIIERPGLYSALSLCNGGLADVLVSYAQDRLARKTGIFDDIRDTAKKHSYRLETAKDGQDLTREENELSSDAMAFVATVERKMIAKRLYGGRKERSKVDGRGSGPIPWGYIVGVGGLIEVDQEAARVIQMLLTLRSTHTYAATAAAMNSAGLRTQKGKPWSISHVQKIERHKELYTTGVREWDGLEAIERWPVLSDPIS